MGHSMDRVNTRVEQIQMKCAHSLFVEDRWVTSWKKIAQINISHSRDLAMNGQEERTVFDVVKVKTIEARSERKNSNQCTLVCK